MKRASPGPVRPKPSRKSRPRLIKLDPRAAERFDALLADIGHAIAFVKVPRDALAEIDEVAPAVTVLDEGLARLDAFRENFDRAICHLWAGSRTSHEARKALRKASGRRAAR